MSDSMEELRRKINTARELGSVVRTMKALAAASITQYERAVRSLAEYYHAIELGLYICIRRAAAPGGVPVVQLSSDPSTTTAIVFGSDQGLVGQFNDQLITYVLNELGQTPGEQIFWAVGERVAARLQDADLSVNQIYSVPNSVTAITPLVSQILLEQERGRPGGNVYVFHNRMLRGSYEPVKRRLLPLATKWHSEFSRIKWPTNRLPEALGSGQATMMALIREYLFVSVFKACAESLASENACRLAAMQRAQRNIDELLGQLQMAFHHQRQTSIDEELFDVISGFEVLATEKHGIGSKTH
jgi:F-type H+-transporting ATPase subunit gamma